MKFASKTKSHRWLGMFAFGLVVLNVNVGYADCPPKTGGYPDCSQGHCSRTSMDAGMNQWCIGAGFAGCPMLQVERARSCFCICSCVAGDTLVQLANGETIMAQDLREGDEIASPFAKNAGSRISMVSATDATGFAALKLHLNNGLHIVVSENHVFLGADGNYYSADALMVGHKLSSQSQEPMEVMEIEIVKPFNGMLYNFVINNNSQDRNEHLIITNGLISADFILQNEIDREFVAANQEQVAIRNEK